MSRTHPVDRCGAKTRAGSPCQLPAGHGTTHVGTGRCRRHGGASPQAELSGAVQLARRESTVMGAPLDVEPHVAILECIHITAGEVRYASEQIAQLEPDDAAGSVITTVQREGASADTPAASSETRHGPPALHIWIIARHDAMDRLVHYSKVAIAAGIAERQVRIAEQQGQLFADAIRGILADLGVADRPEAPAVVRRHLTAIAGGRAAA
jgi:hypothetical protein